MTLKYCICFGPCDLQKKKSGTRDVLQSSDSLALSTLGPSLSGLQILLHIGLAVNIALLLPREAASSRRFARFGALWRIGPHWVRRWKTAKKGVLWLYNKKQGLCD